MLFSSLPTVLCALAIFTASADALPRPGKQPTTYTPASDLSKLAKLIPLNGLPAPVGQLKYVVLGIGTQNYTCLGSDPSAAPASAGAVATLYDIGTNLNNDPMAEWKIPSLSPLALALSSYPSTLAWSLSSQGYDHIVGHHFFKTLSGTNTPTFAFDQLAVTPFPQAQVGKLNETVAPTNSCPGLAGEGAVKWLYLKDTKGLSQGGIDTVYRLETAGGSSPTTCKDMPTTFEVKYAAQYWVFGPRK